MSLGIKLLGRAQSRSVFGFGVSLVPRGPPKCSCASTARFLGGRHRPLHHGYSTATAAENDHGRIHASGPGAAASKPALTNDDQVTSVAMTSRPVTTVGEHLEVDEVVELAKASLRDRGEILTEPDTQATDGAGTTRVKVPAASVLEPVVMRYPNKRETAASLSRHFNKKHQKLATEKLQARRDVNLPDWRSVLSMLQNRTPEATWNTPSNSRSLLISEEVADTLLYEVDQTLWDIARRTDCDLVLCKTTAAGKPAGNKTSSAATVVLYGSDGAIELAKKEILHLTAAIKAAGPAVPTDGNSAQPPAIPKDDGSLALWSSLRRYDRPSYRKPYHWERKYEDIEEPVVWTKHTLEEYLLAVTSARISPQRKARFYGSRHRVCEAVISLLENRLLTAETTDALSTRAFTIALEYIARAGIEFRPSTRRLLKRMAAVGVPMDTSIYNILLSSNAKAADLKNFQGILYQMTTRGFLPNLNTWQHFLELMADKGVKQHIFRKMNDRGLLKGLKGRQIVAHHQVIYDLEIARGQWKGIRPFLESQNRQYGPDWMTVQSRDAVMNELGRMGKLASCIEFLDLISQQPDAPPLTTSTLNILLSHAKSHHDFNLALVALARFHPLKVPCDDGTYNELFNLCVRHRYANAISVVWRLACMEGKASARMCTRVSDLYYKCPFLVSPNIPMPEVGLSKVSTRLPSAVHPTGRYWAFPHLPTLHHPDMVPQLVICDNESGHPGAGTEGTEPKEQMTSRLQPSIGVHLGMLFRRRWPIRGWRTVQPLHALLAEAVRADRILAAQSTENIQLAKDASPDQGYLELTPELPTNVERTSAPGMQILLTRRQQGKNQQKKPQEAANGGEQAQGNPSAAQASGSREESARVSKVIDIGPIIFSRTYGVRPSEPAGVAGPSEENPKA